MTVNPAKMIFVAVVYFLAAKLGLLVAFEHTNASPVWPPSGIALAAVLLQGYRIWPAIAIGAFFANLSMLSAIGFSGPAPVAGAFITAAGNTLEALTGAFLIQRFTAGRNPFDRSIDVVKFAVFGAFISTAVSATIGVSTLCTINGSWMDFGLIWLTWWWGDATGILVFVPLLMTWSKKMETGLQPRQVTEAVIFILFLLITGNFVFSQYHALIYLLLPYFIFAAIRFGQFEASFAILLISFMAILKTFKGSGPFVSATLNESFLLLQGYLGVISLTTMMLSSIVSERRRADDSRIASEERYKTLFEGIPDAIFIADTETGIILDANPAAAVLLAKSHEEIIGLHQSKLHPSQMEKETKEGFTEYTLMSAGTEARGPFETLIVSSDGVEVPVEIISHTVIIRGRKVLVGVFRDITERRLSESVLRQREAELNESQRVAHIGSWDWDAVTDTIWWSDEYYHIYNHDPRQPTPNYAEHLKVYTAESAGRLDAAVKRAMETGEPYEVDLELANPTVTARWIVARGEAKRDAGGRIRGLRGTAQDITDRKRAEEEIRKLNEGLEQRIIERTAELYDSQRALVNIVEDLNLKTEELKKANIRLQEMDRMKSMFIASMSHELRTPLNSIIGFSSILLNEWTGPVNAEQKENLSTILRSGRHLLNLINDVIDVSKIEAGKIDSVIERFDLHDVIEEAVNFFAKEINEKRLSLTVEVMHQEMHTDRRRLLQCVLNLLSNAVKFTEKGSLNVQARMLNDDFVEISVADTGIGIREEDCPKLFDAFVRLEYPVSASIPGTGLGLYLSKKLAAEVLKGDIILSSRYGEGSTFTIVVPAEIDETSAGNRR